MRRVLVVVMLGLVTFGAGWSVPKAKGGNESRHVDVSAPASCVCYCKGKKVGLGASACMGGFRQRCQDRNGDGRNCGWDSEKDSSGNYIRCDGDWCG